jgi:hypothetical protein
MTVKMNAEAGWGHRWVPARFFVLEKSIKDRQAFRILFILLNRESDVDQDQNLLLMIESFYIGIGCFSSGIFGILASPL